MPMSLKAILSFTKGWNPPSFSSFLSLRCSMGWCQHSKLCSLGCPGIAHYVKEASLEPIKDLPGSHSQVPHLAWRDFLSGCGNEPLLVLQSFGLVER